MLALYSMRRDPAQAPRKGLVAVAADVFEDVFRIDHTAVAQRDAHLLAVEIHMLGVAHVPAVAGIEIQQALHPVSGNDV